MADEKSNRWVELSEKLLIPVLIFLGGIAYTIHKDTLDAVRQADERTQVEKRQQLERDSGYIRMLVSSNDKEQDLGLRIISVLQSEGKFSTDLVPVVLAMKQGRPSDPATQAATRIFSNLTADKQPGQKSPAAVPETATPVYIQIGQEGQRQRAADLQATLRQKGFSAPGIELVAHPTFHTYVRYFADDQASRAGEVNTLLAQLGFKPSVQNFAHSTEQKSESLEVWFGADETGGLQR